MLADRGDSKVISMSPVEVITAVHRGYLGRKNMISRDTHKHLHYNRSDTLNNESRAGDDITRD